MLRDARGVAEALAFEVRALFTYTSIGKPVSSLLLRLSSGSRWVLTHLLFRESAVSAVRAFVPLATLFLVTGLTFASGPVVEESLSHDIFALSVSEIRPRSAVFFRKQCFFEEWLTLLALAFFSHLLALRTCI